MNSGLLCAEIQTWQTLAGEGIQHGRVPGPQTLGDLGCSTAMCHQPRAALRHKQQKGLKKATESSDKAAEQQTLFLL